MPAWFSVCGHRRVPLSNFLLSCSSGASGLQLQTSSIGN
jgi:hypothetical protein